MAEILALQLTTSVLNIDQWSRSFWIA